MAVITLNVEPGGCRAEKAWPASASTLPFSALSTAAPPKVLPSAAAVASCRSASIVVRTGSPGIGARRAISVLPSSPEANSLPPGVPERTSSNASSRPLVPAGVPLGKPAAFISCWRSGGGSEVSPVTMPPLPLVVRPPAGPWASGVRSAARIGARFGTFVSLINSSPSPRPGKTRLGCQLTPPSATGTAISPLTSPNAVVWIVVGRATTSVPSWSIGPRVSPTATAVAVAVVASRS